MERMWDILKLKVAITFFTLSKMSKERACPDADIWIRLSAWKRWIDNHSGGAKLLHRQTNLCRYWAVLEIQYCRSIYKIYKISWVHALYIFLLAFICRFTVSYYGAFTAFILYLQHTKLLLSCKNRKMWVFLIFYFLKRHIKATVSYRIGRFFLLEINTVLPPAFGDW